MNIITITNDIWIGLLIFDIWLKVEGLIRQFSHIQDLKNAINRMRGEKDVIIQIILFLELYSKKL